MFLCTTPPQRGVLPSVFTRVGRIGRAGGPRFPIMDGDCRGIVCGSESDGEDAEPWNRGGVLGGVFLLFVLKGALLRPGTPIGTFKGTSSMLG